MSLAVISPSFVKGFFNFLASMRLAVVLLVALALASVVGTVIKQNEPYNNYLIQFGPFWFEIFEKLGVYNVYGAWWFVAVLVFLVLSTSTCLVRNTPRMVREMRRLVQRGPAARLDRLPEYAVRTGFSQSAVALERVTGVLRAHSYRFRVEEGEQGMRIAADKGSLNRLGYVFTHVAIVVVCLGALLDGNMVMQWKLFQGTLVPEKDFNIPVSQVPESAWLGPESGAFRGNVSIPEGDSAGIVFLQVNDGYLVQDLGFRVKVKDFRVEHYSTGMPKNFESDLVIVEDGQEVREATIGVNHPLVHKGVAIYQASFGDGGSVLDTRAHFFASPTGDPVRVRGVVGESLPFADLGFSIEFKDFSPFNVVPVEDEDKSGRKHENLGPSFNYILRDSSGVGIEFKTYMAPIVREGHPYYVQGVRGGVNDPFTYLFIPLDGNASLELFDRYFALVRKRSTEGDWKPEMLFVESFQDAVAQYGVGMSDEEKEWFLKEALAAMLQLKDYPAPFFLSLHGFDQVQSTGLQITRSPGKGVVYFGSVLLIFGVFLMFYMPHRKLWLRIHAVEGAAKVEMGGASNRNEKDFSREFATLVGDLDGKV